MNKDKLFSFQKRWNALEKQRKDLGYQFALWARDLRAEFPKDDAGDAQFIKSCVEWFKGIDEPRAKSLLTQARAAESVPDERTFLIVGGARQIEKLAPLEKKEQIATIEAAKLQNKTISTVIRERAVAQGKLPPPPPRVNHLDNAQKLARYIKRTCKKIPKDIEMILKYYPEINTLAPVRTMVTATAVQ